MSARLLALVGLSIVSSTLGRSESIERPATTAAAQRKVVVYLRSTAAQSAEALGEMRHETSMLLDPAGYSLEWRSSDQSPETSDFLSVVELKGHCDAEQGGARVENGAKLATTAVSDGKILPFTSIDCPLVSRFVAPSLAEADERSRVRLLGRAMGRILAHELYHILADTHGHDESGASKASFSARDVLSAHFDFSEAAIARVSRPSEGARPELDDDRR